MNRYLLDFKSWYETRSTRERIYIVLLGWALLYAIFYFLFFRSLDAQEVILRTEIKESRNKAAIWEREIAALKKLPDTPLYKQWLSQQRTMAKLQEQYKFILASESSKEWQDIVREILQSQPNIRLEEIKNLPPSAYNPNNIENSVSKIYQESLLLEVYGNYFDTVAYLQQLEKMLPSIHWNSFTYQVAQYPLAKVNMELSLLYEKNGNGNT